MKVRAGMMGRVNGSWQVQFQPLITVEVTTALWVKPSIMHLPIVRVD